METYIECGDWITDNNGNRASITFWKSRDEAIRTLKTLRQCIDCTNCVDCDDCRGCIECKECILCSACSNCLECENCVDCKDCKCSYTCTLSNNLLECTSCSNCSGCTECRNCMKCTDCYNCAVCLQCDKCMSCRDCHGCNMCSELSDNAFLSRSIHAAIHAAVNGRDVFDFDGVIGMDRDEAPPVPVIENIDSAVYNVIVADPEARLYMGDWHSCDTTHCRAGWAIHLAGDAGYALESYLGSTSLAALLIHEASGSPINPCRFFEESEEALADIENRARQTQQKEV